MQLLAYAGPQNLPAECPATVPFVAPQEKKLNSSKTEFFPRRSSLADGCSTLVILVVYRHELPAPTALPATFREVSGGIGNTKFFFSKKNLLPSDMVQPVDLTA